ncbi:MAG TPA: NAD(P)-dependent oxidoreductase [Allosphingosinicella sp.]|nr:NAD(P)-dependent oxidoreductase [Allosphingosinicella sp.]
MNARILMVGDAEPLISVVASAMRARGHDVEHRESFHQFTDDPRALTDVDVLYAFGGLPVTEAHLAAAPRLRALISPFTGTEGFDRDAATRRNIVIGMGQTVENYVSMAEATIMLVLAALYDLPASQAQFGQWGTSPVPLLPRKTLRGRTLGLIGLGRIAHAMVERLAGWECRILAHTRREPEALPSQVELVPLDSLLSQSDVVCVLATLDASSRHLLDEKRLRSMKRDAVLVNTARGGLIDEAALAKVVAEGHLATLALDVFDTEPLPADSPLRELPRSILTPHNIGHTIDTVQSLPTAGIANIDRVLAGDPPLYVRNPEVLPAWRQRWKPDGAGSE